MTHDPDSILVKRCRRGQEAAWNDFLRRFYPEAALFVYQLDPVFGPEEVAAICDDIFPRMVELVDQDRASVPTRVQLLIEALQTTRECRQSWARDAAARRDAGAESPAAEPAPSDQESAVDSEGLSLRLLLDHAGVNCRDVIELIFFAGLSRSELALALGLTGEMVEMRLQTCLTRLEVAELRSEAAGMPAAVAPNEERPPVPAPERSLAERLTQYAEARRRRAPGFPIPEETRSRVLMAARERYGESFDLSWVLGQTPGAAWPRVALVAASALAVIAGAFYLQKAWNQSVTTGLQETGDANERLPDPAGLETTRSLFEAAGLPDATETLRTNPSLLIPGGNPTSPAIATASPPATRKPAEPIPTASPTLRPLPAVPTSTLPASIVPSPPEPTPPARPAPESTPAPPPAAKQNRGGAVLEVLAPAVATPLESATEPPSPTPAIATDIVPPVTIRAAPPLPSPSPAPPTPTDSILIAAAPSAPGPDGSTPPAPSDIQPPRSGAPPAPTAPDAPAAPAPTALDPTLLPAESYPEPQLPPEWDPIEWFPGESTPMAPVPPASTIAPQPPAAPAPSPAAPSPVAANPDSDGSPLGSHSEPAAIGSSPRYDGAAEAETQGEVSAVGVGGQLVYEAPAPEPLSAGEDGLWAIGSWLTEPKTLDDGGQRFICKAVAVEDRTSSNGPPPPNLLRDFRLRPSSSGGELVDADGSLYAFVFPAARELLGRAAFRTSQVAPARVEDTENGGGESAREHGNPDASVLEVVSFKAAGLHRSTGQWVVVDGFVLLEGAQALNEAQVASDWWAWLTPGARLRAEVRLGSRIRFPVLAEGTARAQTEQMAGMITP